MKQVIAKVAKLLPRLVHFDSRSLFYRNNCRYLYNMHFSFTALVRAEGTGYFAILQASSSYSQNLRYIISQNIANWQCFASAYVPTSSFTLFLQSSLELRGSTIILTFTTFFYSNSIAPNIWPRGDACFVFPEKFVFCVKINPFFPEVFLRAGEMRKLITAPKRINLKMDLGTDRTHGTLDQFWTSCSER